MRFINQKTWLIMNETSLRKIKLYKTFIEAPEVILLSILTELILKVKLKTCYEMLLTS